MIGSPNKPMDWFLSGGFLTIRLDSSRTASVEPGIVILKGLPVLQCASCPQYLLEDAVLARVDQILRQVDGGTELEVIRYAA